MYHQNEVEQSAYNFEHSDVEFLLGAFASHEKQAKYLMEQQLALPAYEQVLKAAHTFNLLDARGAISVTERAAYIGRIRNLARSVAKSYKESRRRLDPPFPMAPRAWADEAIAQMDKEEARAMTTTRNLLVELFVEELPPKSLKKLGDSFCRSIGRQSQDAGPRGGRCGGDRLRFAAPPGGACHRCRRTGRRQIGIAKADAGGGRPAMRTASPRQRC